MHLLADENVPLPVVEGLRREGHDVRWVGDRDPGIGDQEVLRKAHGEGRLLLTFDKDFGTLIFREEAGHPVGILLFRLPPLSKEELVRFVTEIVEERDD